MADAKRVADCEDKIAHLHAARIGEGKRGQRFTARIDLEDGESLYGQLGTRFTAPMQYAEIYFNAGVKHQFLGEAGATVSGLTFTNDMPGTQGLIAAGVQAMADDEQLLLSVETAYAKGTDASELAASVNMELKF